jgi:sulfonate transport system permease protein
MSVPLAERTASPVRFEAPSHSRPGLVQPRARRAVGHARGTGALRLVGPLVLFALWWIGTATGKISKSVLASPPKVLSCVQELIRDDRLFHQIAVSLTRSGKGLFFGVSIGLILGAAVGLSRLAEQLLDSSLQMGRTIPFLALVPLFIVWLGIGETPKILLIALATMFPMYLNTYNGVRNVDRRVVEAMRAYDLSGFRLVREILFPLALPSILTGLRYSLGVSVLALLAAEQINASEGLGALLYTAQISQRVDILMVVLIIYALIGIGADLIVRGLERLLMPWHKGVATR